MSTRYTCLKLLRALLPAALAMVGSGQAYASNQKVEQPAVDHAAILTLDTHLDVPMHFDRPGWNFGDRHSPADDIAQVDLPRMLDGHLDGGFFVVYTPQGLLEPSAMTKARGDALARCKAINRTIAENPRFERALTAADARAIARRGNAIGFISMENSYPVGMSVAGFQAFYDCGVRMAGPVHTRNNQLADSSTDQPRWGGLSPLGREWVREMNRLGVVIDASHASDAALDQMLELSQAPLILSHSGSRAVFQHPRNVDDDRIRRLAASGGVISATTVYLAPMRFTPERERLFARLDRIAELSPQEQAQLVRDIQTADRDAPLQSATLDRFMESLLYLIQIAGIDHVAIGADWDGGGGLVDLPDISANARITARLADAGFSASDIAKIWSGNVLRVVDAAARLSVAGGRDERGKAND